MVVEVCRGNWDWSSSASRISSAWEATLGPDARCETQGDRTDTIAPGRRAATDVATLDEYSEQPVDSSHWDAASLAELPHAKVAVDVDEHLEQRQGAIHRLHRTGVRA